jgi:hypothetical protein
VCFFHSTRFSLKDDLTRAREITRVNEKEKRKPVPFVKTFDNTVESARKKYLNKLKSEVGDSTCSLHFLPDRDILPEFIEANRTGR